jgi:hypothetical protein
VDKTTAQQPKVQQFGTDRQQGLGLRKFSVKIPPPYNSPGNSKIKIILSTRSTNKTTARQPKVPQVDSTGFQDRQTAAAETSGNYYYNSGGKPEGGES